MDQRKRRAMQLVSGVALAISAAQLFVTGSVAAAADKEKAKIHCTGVNSCKGKSECSSAKNGCQGQNECKGQGWVSMTQKQCVDKGGKPEKS